MSGPVTTRVWRESKQTKTALLLLVKIADNVNNDAVGFAGNEYLARNVRVSVRQTQRLIDDLQKAGELYVKPGNGRGNQNLTLVTVGLTYEAIEQRLIDYFEMSPFDAKNVTLSISEKRKALAIKGDILKQKRVTKNAIKGDIVTHESPTTVNRNPLTGNTEIQIPLQKSAIAVSADDPLAEELDAPIKSPQFEKYLERKATEKLSIPGDPERLPKESSAKEKVPFTVLHDSTPLLPGDASLATIQRAANDAILKAAHEFLTEPIPSHPPGKNGSAGESVISTIPSSATPAPIKAPEPRHDDTTPTPVAYNPLPPGYEWRGWNGFKHLVRAGTKTPKPKPLCGVVMEGIVTSAPNLDASLIPCAACLEKSAPKKSAPRKPQPSDIVFDAMVGGLARTVVITPESRTAHGWRVGQILHGDKKHGRCAGLLIYEAQRQHVEIAALDYNALAGKVVKFWQWFREAHADIDLKDCAKFVEYWSVWVNLHERQASPVEVIPLDDSYVAPGPAR